MFYLFSFYYINHYGKKLKPKRLTISVSNLKYNDRKQETTKAITVDLDTFYRLNYVDVLGVYIRSSKLSLSHLE